MHTKSTKLIFFFLFLFVSNQFDAPETGVHILIIDDLIATGGTVAASCELIEKFGTEVVACAFVVELDFLEGREKLLKYNVHSLIHY